MRALVSVLDFKSRLHSILGIVILRCLAQLCTNMFPLSLKQMVTECGLRKNLVSFQWSHGTIWPLQGIAGPIQPSSPLADGSLHCYNRFKHESSNLHLITFAYSPPPPPPPPPPLLHRRQRRSKPSLLRKLPFSSSARVESNFVASCKSFARNALPHGPRF